MSILRNIVHSVGGNVSKILVSIGGIVILGRILGPEIFGEFAIVMAVHTMLQPFINIGLGPAYYKVPKEDDKAANAFFTLQTILGLAVSILVALAAYPLAYYYENNSLVGLFLLLALSQAFLGLGLQPYAELTRDNKYGSVAMIQLTALIVGLGTGIAMAVGGWGVWSLAAKFLVTAGLSMAGYFWLAGQRYRFVEWKGMMAYRDSFVFSIKLGLGRLVSGVSDGLDKMMLGSYFSEGVLGNYDRAFQFSQYPDSAIRNALTNPILTFIAHDPNPEDKYLRIFKAIHILAGMICVGFFVYGDTLIRIMLGAEWELAATLFPILAVLALGKVLRGIYLVVEINEGNGDEILRKSVVSTLFVYSVGFIALYTYENVRIFSLLFSLAWLGYWLVSLLVFLVKKSGAEAAKKMVVFFLSSTLLLAAIGFLVRHQLYGVTGSRVIDLTVAILLTTVLFLASFGALYSGDAKEIWSLIKRKK